jgi:hypothetical protein
MTVQRQEIIDVLRPFAMSANIMGPFGEDMSLVYIKLGDCRAVRSLLQRLEAEGEEPADAIAALKHVRSIIVDGAMVGFNPLAGGDWAERLFASQQMTSRIVGRFDKLNQEGGDAADTVDQSEPARPGVHVAPPASGADSGRAKIAEQIAKSHIDTGFGEAMDELMAGELADKIERALASEYERGAAAGERSGIEKAAKVADNRPYANPDHPGNKLRPDVRCLSCGTKGCTTAWGDWCFACNVKRMDRIGGFFASELRRLAGRDHPHG